MRFIRWLVYKTTGNTLQCKAVLRDKSGCYSYCVKWQGHWGSHITNDGKTFDTYKCNTYRC